MFGHDKDGFVREELHRVLHTALLCFHTAQSLNVQITWEDNDQWYSR